MLSWYSLDPRAIDLKWLEYLEFRWRLVSVTLVESALGDRSMLDTLQKMPQRFMTHCYMNSVTSVTLCLHPGASFLWASRSFQNRLLHWLLGFCSIPCLGTTKSWKAAGLHKTTELVGSPASLTSFTDVTRSLQCSFRPQAKNQNSSNSELNT